MGQYYRACFLNEAKNQVNSFVKSYDFGSGAKLMEHSYQGNAFVGFVESKLVNEPKAIVWAGDYADNEPNTEHNLYDLSSDGRHLKLTNHPDDPYSDEAYKVMKKEILPKRYKYLINYDKKEFVNKSKIESVSWTENLTIHPLPLLTCEGNGRGGGDYRNDKGQDLIGSWARNTIGVVSRKSDIPKDFKEIEFTCNE